MRTAALRNSHIEVAPRYLVSAKKRWRGIAEGIGEPDADEKVFCRYHSTEPMKLVTSAHPIMFGGRATNFHAETKRRLRERKIWRCAVEGCPSVARVRGEDLEEPEIAE